MRKKVIKVRDINKNGKKDGFEKARARGMAKGMGARVELKAGGKPGLYANIHAKKARIAAGSGEKMRRPGDKSKKGKVKKVIKGLKKASKLHAGQAKVLKKVIKKK